MNNYFFQKEIVTESGNFKVSVENGLRVITLNRPKKFNALLSEVRLLLIKICIILYYNNSCCRIKVFVIFGGLRC